MGNQQRAFDRRLARGALLRAVTVFAILALVAGTILYVLFDVRADATRSEAGNLEQEIVERGRLRMAAGLAAAVSDARYLAREQTLLRWLETDDPAGLQDLAADYLAFSTEKAAYDGIRFLDLDGREMVRVDWNGGNPAVVPDDRLQERVDRYYIAEIAKLEAGQVYISPFDLEAERGVIEQPIKPMIRFGAPVFDRAGRKRGMVILNYRGQRLLGRIGSLAGGDRDRIWLLNAEGHWLLGPRPEDEWAFMYPERPDRSFAQAYPEVWQRIGSGTTSGQFFENGDLFTFAPVSFAAGRAGAAQTIEPERDPGLWPTWILVAHLPASALAERQGELVRGFLLAAAALAALLLAVAMVAARRDLHHRQTERLRRASESRFRAVADSASDGVITADASGRVTYLNGAAERMFGYAAEEIVERPLTLLMPERFREAHSEGLQRIASGGEPRVIGTTLDLVGLRKDSTEFPLELSLASAMIDRERQFTGIVRDVTQRKEAEQQILEREARFRALLEAGPDGIIITDTQGRIELVNAQTERVFGYPRDRLIGQPIEMLVPERFQGRHIKHREGYVAEPRPRRMGFGLELYGLRADGSEFPVAISLSPVETAEGARVIAAIRDVTDRRRIHREMQVLNERLTRDNTELAAVNKELEAFSYSVSHDLRAPLRAIDGFSQALLEDCADSLGDIGRDHLGRVRRAAQRMGVLIDDLIKLSRVTRADMHLQDVDLTALAQGIARDLQAAEPDRTAEFTIADGLATRGDARLLTIALENLMGNAWKFTAGRRPAVIEFGSRRQDGETAFFVRDNGAGFDMAYADKLFRAFQRLHDTTQFAGTGIGLATVQRIIHKHGGRIWATGKVGEGATFYFTL